MLPAALRSLVLLAALGTVAPPPALARTDTISAQFPRCAAGPRVTCVVDGDTIWLEGTKIRLADIDTPETGRPRCPAEAARGEDATRRLQALLNRGAFLLLPAPDGRDEDRFGRKLRVIARNGESLGAILVREDLARPWGGRRRGWCG